MGWLVVDIDDTVQVIPTHDKRNHVLGHDCWCNPETDAIVDTLVTHRDELDRLELESDAA